MPVLSISSSSSSGGAYVKSRIAFVVRRWRKRRASDPEMIDCDVSESARNEEASFWLFADLDKQRTWIRGQSRSFIVLLISLHSAALLI